VEYENLDENRKGGVMAAITPAVNPVHWNHDCEPRIYANKYGTGGVWIDLPYHNTKTEEIVTLNMCSSEALEWAVKLIEAAREEQSRRDSEDCSS
jgi:hypothetical protein